MAIGGAFALALIALSPGTSRAAGAILHLAPLSSDSAEEADWSSPFLPKLHLSFGASEDGVTSVALGRGDLEQADLATQSDLRLHGSHLARSRLTRAAAGALVAGPSSDRLELSGELDMARGRSDTPLVLEFWLSGEFPRDGSPGKVFVEARRQGETDEKAPPAFRLHLWGWLEATR